MDAFNVDPLYLQHKHQGEIPDYRHWHIPLGRRFRSLKLWFVMRLYGVEGLQAHIREQVRARVAHRVTSTLRNFIVQVKLAEDFAELVKQDDRFELPFPPKLGLVCFRLRASNTVNETLNKKINEAGKIHMTPSKVRDTFILRFAVCSRFTLETDIHFAWQEILNQVENMEVKT